MILRDAEADDAAIVCEIWNKIIRDSTKTFTSNEKTLEGITDQIANNEVFLAAEQNGTVVGFCTMMMFRSGPGYAGCRELTLHLSEEARGQGVGRRMVEALAQRARRLGIHSLIGGVSGANPAAIAFHKALGFDQVGRLPEIAQKFGQRLDLVLMLKKL